MQKIERVDSIDHLRGILAVTIMIYHYIAWSFPNWMSPDSLISVLGYYGVSAFFVISGISLAIAYDGRLATFQDAMIFFRRRIFRIVPLYWLAVSSTIILAIYANIFWNKPYKFTMEDVIANYLMSFSFGHSNALAAGGWSIGNEIFFYLCFPLLFWLTCKSAKWAIATVTCSFIFLSIWAFIIVPSNPDPLIKWDSYIQNMNQLFFFVAGVTAGRYIKSEIFNKRISYTLLLIALTLLSTTNVIIRSDLIANWHRIILSCATLLLVISVYQINWNSSAFLGQALRFLGLISYSLYMLHPLVRSAVRILGEPIGISPIMTLIVSVTVTIVASWISYKLIEIPGIRLGKIIEQHLNRKTITA